MHNTCHQSLYTKAPFRTLPHIWMHFNVTSTIIERVLSSSFFQTCIMDAVLFHARLISFSVLYFFRNLCPRSFWMMMKTWKMKRSSMSTVITSLTALILNWPQMLMWAPFGEGWMPISDKYETTNYNIKCGKPEINQVYLKTTRKLVEPLFFLWFFLSLQFLNRKFIIFGERYDQ